MKGARELTSKFTSAQVIKYFEHPSNAIGELPPAKWNDEVSMVCPLHNDGNPSFSLNLEKGGLWNCFSVNCPSYTKDNGKGGGDIFTFEMHHGDKDGNAINFEQAKAQVFEILGIKPQQPIEYTYLAPDGNYNSTMKRWEWRTPDNPTVQYDKTFAVYVGNIKGSPKNRYLYNAPSVLKAEAVLILEGEKCCDCVNGLLKAAGITNVIATTPQHGASAPWLSSYTDCLKDKTVYICPDNDAAGLIHAAKVLSSVKQVATQTKVIYCPLKYESADLADYLPEQDNPLQVLMQLMESAIDATPKQLKENAELLKEDDGLPPLGVDKPDNSLTCMPEACMYGYCADLAKDLDISLGFAYPAVLAVCSALGIPECPDARSNVYVGLLGPVETGKSIAMERALRIIPTKEPVVEACPGSERGLAKSIGGEEKANKSFLLHLDELGAMLKKIKIQNNALAPALCTLWNKNTYSCSDKTGVSDKIDCRFTILGGLKITDSAQFAEMFGTETDDGLASRFIFGLAPQGFEWEVFDKLPVDMLNPTYVNFTQSARAMLREWRKQKPGRGRLGENANRVALITASINGDSEITDACMAAALKFAEWQEAIKETYKTGKAETMEGKCTEAILNVVAAIPESESRKWSDLGKFNNWYAKYGVSLCKRVRDSLASEGMICYHKASGKVWNPQY